MTNEAVTYPICPSVRNEHTRGSKGAPFGPVIKLRGPVWASLLLRRRVAAYLFDHSGSPLNPFNGVNHIKKSSKTFHDFSHGEKAFD